MSQKCKCSSGILPAASAVPDPGPTILVWIWIMALYLLWTYPVSCHPFVEQTMQWAFSVADEIFGAVKIKIFAQS